jgi:4-amino-4-deoxy-L-arabinose transferase-like glycosyltransferase
MKDARLDRALCFGLAVAYVALLVATASTLGYARDEGFYFYAAGAYRRWLDLLASAPGQAFERANVDRFFVVNHEHPALMKLAFALSHALFHEKLGWLAEPGTAYRLPGMLSAALAIAVIYAWGSRTFGRAGAMVAALSFAFMPRVFHHAHLACFDVPIAALLLATAYAYARAIETRRLGWLVACGVLYGLSLNTKHNSWLLPFALVLHVVLLRRSALASDLAARRLPVPRALLALALLGPLVFFVSWPWLWFDTLERLAEYVRFHRAHDYYNMEFLGTTYWKPPMPRAYAWVMTLGTVPLVTLLLFGVGAVRAFFAAIERAREQRSALAVEAELARPGSNELLWLLGVLVNYAPWWSPETPIFGGTKHWITAYPFLCLLAGRGFALITSAARDALRARFASLPPRFEHVLGAFLGACVLVGPAVMTLHAHPFGLSFYAPLVGGAPGAASLGLNRTFWGYTTGSTTEFLNARSRAGGRVFLHDTAASSWDMLQRDGRVTSELRGTLALEDSDLALYHFEPHMGRVEYQIWVDFETVTPAFLVAYDGVPIVWVYERARSSTNR